jgi:hypothetical protein
LASAAQLAARLHAAVPLVMVTRVPAMEQPPLAVITAVVLAFVVVATVKVDWYAALAGAPVKVTVGAIFVAVVDWAALAAV